jgi:arylsulfatase A-like enzyme
MTEGKGQKPNFLIDARGRTALGKVFERRFRRGELLPMLKPLLAMLSCPLVILAACDARPQATEKQSATQHGNGAHTTAVAQQPAESLAEKPTVPCPQKPNILIVVLDTLRFDATALDSRSRNPTPFLAELAASGVNFTNCYSTHDSTPPSHASLFSGFLHAYHTTLDQPNAPIAHQFRMLGYHTFAVVANGNLSPKSFPMMIPFQDSVNVGDLWMDLNDTQKAEVSHSSDEVIRQFGGEPNDSYRQFLWSTTPRLLPRIRRRLEQTAQPFLGFINLIDCHDPYIAESRFYSVGAERLLRKGRLAPPRFRKLSAELETPDSIADPVRREFVKKKIQQAQGRAWSVALDLSRVDLAIYRMRYNAAARQLSDGIASIFTMLERNRLRASTIVVITSDHGESFGEADLLTHSFNDQGDRESTHRVPMLIVFPPCYGLQGVAIKATCTIADVTPTLYDLVGIDGTRIWRLAPPGETGHSLLPLLKTNVAPQAASASPDPARWTPIPADERTRMESEALRRLKSLGYVQ